MKYLITALILSVLIVVLTYEPTDRDICLITYNIKYDNHQEGPNSWASRKSSLIRLLLNHDPDIFGIQEGLVHQVQEIDLGMKNHAYVGVGRDDGKEKGEYCAIFFDSTRFRVIDESTFWLSENPDTVSIGWDAALERICTMALFEDRTSQQRLWVFNTHFDHIGKKARRESASLIASRIETIKDDGYPIVLMGDFNAKPNEPPIATLKKTMSDGLEIAKSPLQGPVGTFNGFKDIIPRDRIDYIFVSTLSVKSYDHIDEKIDEKNQISDHLPIKIRAQFDWDF